MEKTIIETTVDTIDEKPKVTKIQGLYDRVNIPIKVLDRVIFGGIGLIIMLILVSL